MQCIFARMDVPEWYLSCNHGLHLKSAGSVAKRANS